MLALADNTDNAEEVQKTTLSSGGKLRMESLTAIFGRTGKGKGSVTYSHRQHTHTETR
jgi:hypothetical protein